MENVDENCREIDNILVDAGYYSGPAILEVEKDNGPTVYASVGKKQGKTVEDLEESGDPEPPEKDTMGFHQFLLRGSEKVSTEWSLICLAYNEPQLIKYGKRYL